MTLKEAKIYILLRDLWPEGGLHCPVKPWAQHRRALCGVWWRENEM